jgi:flagellar basal-body rod protein FlgB
MTKIFDGTVHQLNKSLDLRLKQHGLVATNLANKDTPGFLAKRIDFRQAFDRVMQNDRSTSMRKTNPRHIDGLSDGSTPTVTIEAPSFSQDGNSVHGETEMAVMASNNLLYNASAEALSRKLALLRYAASDGGK